MDKILERIMQLFFYPDDGLGGMGDDLDILSADNKGDDAPPDDDTEDKDDDVKDEDESKDDEEPKDEDVDEDEDKDEDEEDDEEEKDDKEEDESEDEDEDEDLKLTSTVTDIKKSFPDFFKKFPDVRAAIFRDQRYAEAVGTPEQAESIAKKSELLDDIENDLFKKADASALLETLQKNGKDAFPKVMSGILPFLQKADKDLYLEIVAVPIKQVLRAAFLDGKGKGKNGSNNDLAKAAQYIHHFFFNGSTDVETPLKSERVGKEEKSDREKEIEEKLQQIEQKEYNSFKSSVDQSYVTRMTNEIRTGLDKDERLTDYAKSKLVEDILTDIRDQLLKDERHNKSLQSLWLQAKKAGFTNDFKSRILSTALARAKSLVPEARKKLVAQALGKRVKDTKEKDKDKDRTTFKRTDKQERKPQRRDMTPKKILSDLDVIRG